MIVTKEPISFGFEREYGVFRKGVLIAAPNDMPRDGDGILAECRGEPNTDPIKAVFLLRLAEHGLKQMAAKAGCQLKIATTFSVSSDVLNAARRQTCKEPERLAWRKNLYGHALLVDTEAANETHRAGLHVHMVRKGRVEHTVTSADGGMKTYSSEISVPFNWAEIVLKLDGAFQKEILDAGRVAGEYEINKKHGGMEYRSLPATVEPLRVAKALAKIVAAL